MRTGPMLAALSVAALCGGWISVASGQTTELISIEEPTPVINIANCQDSGLSFKVTFTNSYDTQFDVSAPYEVWLARSGGCSATDNDPDTLTREDCLGAEGACCQPIEESGAVTMPETGVYQVSLAIDAISDYLSCADGDEGSVEIVVYARPGIRTNLTTEQDSWERKSLTVSYDLARPSPPTGIELAAGETSVSVTWSGASDGLRYRAYAAASPIDSGTPIDDQNLSDLNSSRTTSDGASSATVDGLREMTTYYVVVASIDDLDNESLPSASAEFSTVQVDDFYEYYRESYGGQEPGGYCAVAGGGAGGLGLSVALALLGLLGLRRRRRHPAPRPARSSQLHRWSALLVVLALTAVALPAGAQAESPRSFTLGLSFGSYVPGIDEEFSDLSRTGPYERFFEDDGVFLSRVDMAWHLTERIGVLALGLGVGIGSVSAKGFVEGSTTRAVEESKLRLLPLSGSLSYAFDLIAERYSFPLVPTASVGLDYALWWIYDGAGDVARTTDPKGEGKGGTWGWHYSFGLRLLLDVLAPDMAQSFDLDMGVNNSYLYVEYLVTKLDRFGDRTSLTLSADTLFFGIAFDF